MNAAQGRYRHIKLEQRYKAARLPDIAAIDMRVSPPERGKWLSPVLVEAVAETLAARRAGAAVSEPPRLCAGHRLPELRLQIRMPQLLRLAGRAPLPPPARMPPLRHLRADPRDLPELRGRTFARAVRAGHRAHRRGGCRPLSRCAPRASVERPHPGRERSPRNLARDRGPRGGHRHRHPARGQGPPLSGSWHWSAWSTRISALPMPTRAPPSARFSFSIR